MNTPTIRIAFHTIGCKLNFSETSSIVRDFVQRGYRLVDARDEADIYVINTCSVTENADKDCRKIVRRVLRRNPNAFVAMIGCYAQLKPQEVAEIPGVDAVFGTETKFDLPDYLNAFDEKGKTSVLTTEIKHYHEFIPSYSASERTRVFLKIQDGCDYPCSYCIIPMARGPSRSDSIAKTLKLAREVANTDTKEIVLTGVNIGDFGKGSDETFIDLIRELDRLDGIERIRISSLEPNLLADEIIEFCAASEKFVPHFHIPLQSGSNKILKKMQRRYGRELYASRVIKIKSILPDACIGADVIVGFPGESNADFLETYTFLNELDVSYLHVFTYSKRDNTPASESIEPVPREEKFRRSKMLHILADKKKRFFYDRFLGHTVNVLFETRHDNMLQGHTENYIKVRASGATVLVNRIVPVRLKENKGEHIIGEIRDRKSEI